MSLFRGILVVDKKQLKYGLTEGDSLEDLQSCMSLLMRTLQQESLQMNAQFTP